MHRASLLHSGEFSGIYSRNHHLLSPLLCWSACIDYPLLGNPFTFLYRSLAHPASLFLNDVIVALIYKNGLENRVRKKVFDRVYDLETNGAFYVDSE